MEDQIKARAFEIIEAISAERDRALHDVQVLNNFIVQLAQKLGLDKSDDILDKVDELLDADRKDD